jgi:hypothetical protein
VAEYVYACASGIGVHYICMLVDINFVYYNTTKLKLLISPLLAMSLNSLAMADCISRLVLHVPYDLT